MSEKRILLASLLKPINDTRLYEKLGLSLSKISGVSIHITGYEAPIPAEAPANMHFHPIFRFSRLSAGRIAAQRAHYRLLQHIQPHMVIVSTHELLLPTLLYKARYSNVRIVYDIQENYSLNLRAQHNYSWPLKHLLALSIRTIEKMTAGSIDHFLLAERSYAEELPFLGDRYTFIENKYKAHQELSALATPVSLPTTGTLRLLYSGTIAEEYGVWEAIESAKQLQAIRPASKLTIIGYCANSDTLAKLRQACLALPFVELIGGDKLVPHRDILQQIEKSHIGLLPYRPNASTFRCIPTKLYEYMAHGLPIMIQENPLWQGIVAGNDAGRAVDFRRINIETLYHELSTTNFYKHGIPNAIYWESEEEKLLQIIIPLLSQVQEK
ncbi:glycosyltransferase [Pontibacter virosus]|uniref:Glycosyltransferase involved in cell wall biosynthesis n=1 Tax=Pontibacter virosus TaxID=1765052 RepID=A0A2U1AWN5_9BACT|nr:glycosyltransferase [Pontibacter virosus]PVY40839.1 glycosyltransferase involved in cell wall biosynthesis [Pontibacter virosus]